MPDTTYIFTSRFDIPEGSSEKFEHWCNTRHFPDLLKAGFQSSVAFRSVQGEPQYLHLFEIPGMQVFDSPGMAKVCICDPSCPPGSCLASEDPNRPGAQAMAHFFLNSSRAVYETRALINANPIPKDVPVRPNLHHASIQSPALFTARMDLIPSRAEHYLHWQEQQVFPELVSIQGFRSGRIGRRIDNFKPDRIHEHVASEPEYIIMWELESSEIYRDDNPGLAAARSKPEASQMRTAVNRNLVNLSVRIFPT